MGSAARPATAPLPLLLLLAFAACQAEVQVSVPPVVEVLLGQDASIWCTHSAKGADPYLLVEWFIMDRNGEHRRVAYSEENRRGVDTGTEYTDRVSMDADNSLVIRAVEVSDERNFTCRVMSSTSGSSGGAAHLKVYGAPEAPEVTVNHRTLSVTEDAASEIAKCESRNANPLPTVSWYKDGHPLNAPTERNKELYVVSRTVTEASGLHSISSVLFLRPTKADKDSHFSCQVNYSMPRGEVVSNFSEPFQLQLHYYTENVRFVLISPEVIKEGDDVQLRCQGDGHPPSETVFFKVEAGKAMEDLGTKTDGILLLNQVTKADSGTYRCQVLDFDSPPEVNLEQEMTIDVNYLDPLILNPDKSVSVNLGESVELSCSATGSQTPKLSWRKGKEQVGEGETLALNSLTYHMAGVYTCEASVPSIPGLHRDKTVKVIVEGMPKLEQRQTRSHYHSLNQVVKLTCSALGHPEPEIRWSAPGTVSVNTSGNRVTSELEVEVTAELAQQGVTCQAKNAHGTVDQRFQLEIVSPTTLASPVPTVDGQDGQGGSTVAVIAVCVCVLLLLLIVGFFYFMQRRGCLPCGSGEKRSLTPKEGNPDDTLVEMKTDKRNEQTGLLSPGGGGGGGPNEC
ncbi:basal cell adhesion molecule [Tiliqua scincoides]|uniref:basal cell adhesion molecule n=1 Tax=Tiliqua scincoides TaxID=71010 RepID=UPI0034638375